MPLSIPLIAILTVCSLIAVYDFPLILEIIYVKCIPPSLPWPWVSHHPVHFHISLLSHQTLMCIMASNLFFPLFFLTVEHTVSV